MIEPHDYLKAKVLNIFHNLLKKVFHNVTCGEGVLWLSVPGTSRDVFAG
jgi:hypothetical protein